MGVGLSNIPTCFALSGDFMLSLFNVCSNLSLTIMEASTRSLRNCVKPNQVFAFSRFHRGAVTIKIFFIFKVCLRESFTLFRFVLRVSFDHIHRSIVLLSSSSKLSMQRFLLFRFWPSPVIYHIL